ncbi:hypothetical protein IGI04_031680, partial [Brassica rapa subsp. trilocularis]
NLTDLNLSFSEIEELWEGVKDTPKLKWVDLSHSSKLCNLTGLLNAESLQRLNLEGCTSLEELPREMKRMKCLVFLNMRGCTSLRVLPHMNLISMKTLILTNCSSLQTFRVVSDNLETLHLDGSAIGQLPTNMWKLQRLIVLNLKDCKMLAELPECLGKLKALQELVLSGCSKLKTFPIRIENMKSLQLLLLDGTSITDMPKILQLNSSKVEDWPELRRALFVWLPQVSAAAVAAASAAVAASMRNVVVRFGDADAAAAAAAYHIATAGFIGVSRRTQRSDAAAAAGSCVNERNKS